MLNSILDQFFPRKCICCKKIAKTIVCDSCSPKVISPRSFSKNCFYLYEYKGNPRKIIQDFKLSGHKTTGFQYLKPILPIEFMKDYDLIIPVPCHWFRIIQRKFNHLKFLLKDIPNLDDKIVRRNKYTPPLYKKNKEQRLKIMSEVFSVISPEKINAKRVLIFDDIYTTGATYRELKRVLSEHQPKSVDALFICKV